MRPGRPFQDCTERPAAAVVGSNVLKYLINVLPNAACSTFFEAANLLI